MKVNKIIFIALLFVAFFASSEAAGAQSTDQALPTPILSSDINGKIVALDVGDPRSTRHFYAFAASPGDLLVTVDSKNLNGDIDVFTAITFRPLMKTSVYSSSQSSVTKGIYLRAHQILILRVEARTPNDDPGTYHIHFGGSFEPFSGGIPVAENTENSDSATEKTGSNRLSSVGATIPRPSVQIAETAEAKPSPSPEAAAEKPAETTEAPKTDTAKPASTNTARRTNTRPLRRGTRPAPKTQTAEKKTEPAEPAPTEPKVESSTTAETPSQPKPEKTTAEKPSEPTEMPRPQELITQPGATHLIIEEKDGTRIERPMSTVRRVLVEGPTIVVVLKTGKIERFAMSDVARVAIETR